MAAKITRLTHKIATQLGEKVRIEYIWLRKGSRVGLL
jgi:hypothetical protein